MNQTTNINRAAFGARAVETGTPDFGQNDPQTDLVDALVNVMHHCTRDGLDFAAACGSAERHYLAEK